MGRSTERCTTRRFSARQLDSRGLVLFCSVFLADTLELWFLNRRQGHVPTLLPCDGDAHYWHVSVGERVLHNGLRMKVWRRVLISFPASVSVRL